MTGARLRTTGRRGARAAPARLVLPTVLALSVVVLAMFIDSTAQAAQVAGVEVEDTLEASGTDLQLNGAGLRTRFFIKLYVAGLYTESGSGAAATVAGDNAPMAITLDIVSDRVTRDKMVEALNDGFSASTGGDTSRVADGMLQLQEAMGDEMAAGSTLMFAYHPDQGTAVWRDGAELTVIEGLAFKQALFGIWLSETPVAGKLKTQMLGG